MIASRPLWISWFVLYVVAAPPTACGGLMGGSDSRKGPGSDPGVPASGDADGVWEPGAGGGEGGASPSGGATAFTAGQGGRAASGEAGSAGEGGSAAGIGQEGLAPWHATCGDGWVNPGESCDDGNKVPRDGCSVDCCVEIYDAPPQCYDSSKWCAPHMAPCHCGDGFVEGREQCDDGNLEFGDGCSGYCEIEDGSCGNGVLDGTEECDDGNLEFGDGCDPGCYREVHWMTLIDGS